MKAVFVGFFPVLTLQEVYTIDAKTAAELLGWRFSLIHNNEVDIGSQVQVSDCKFKLRGHFEKHRIRRSDPEQPLASPIEPLMGRGKHSSNLL